MAASLHETAGDPLSRFMLACHDFADANTGLWQLVTEHSFPPEYPFPDWYQDALDAPIVLLEQLIAAASDDAGKKAARLTAETLWNCILGITAAVPADFSARGARHVEPRKLIKRLLDLSRAGLGGVSSRPAT